jgi:hypothetical protein
LVSFDPKTWALRTISLYCGILFSFSYLGRSWIWNPNIITVEPTLGQIQIYKGGGGLWWRSHGLVFNINMNMNISK